MNKNIIQEIRELVYPAEREKARMGFEGYPNDEEIQRLRTTIEEGIMLAQKRLVARAKKDGFTLIACPNGKVVEINPATIVF
ncbi:MAG: hypothetical protein NC113_01055 [Bacteroides sp.]|nr:hypothetical protein [Bacteroides sp.]MCM1446814.1 hypothetical protein [Bacteroides sp.]MCM1514943.1 hypothetical protein [Paraprevotella sp.]